MAPNRRLKQARELRGWSQAKVAEEIGTDATTVSRWERGLFSPTPYFRERLCKLFGKNADELGLLEPAYQPLEREQEGAFFRPPTALPAFETNGTRPREDSHAGNVVAPLPPSWPKRLDTFSYIMHSAAHDQQAHMLWGDAYVRALHGQRAEAQRLGEASMSAFERVGHLNAAAIREWLNQRDLTSLPSAATSIGQTPLPILPEQHPKGERPFLGGKGTGITLILLLLATLVFAGLSLAQVYQTALASSPGAGAVIQAHSLVELAHTTPPAASSLSPPPSPTAAPSAPSSPAPPAGLTVRMTPESLTRQNCFPDSLGMRCDLRFWLFASGHQGQFAWRISGTSTLALTHSPLQGNGMLGVWTQITVYVRPNRRGQQLLFRFFCAAATSTAAVTWEG
ncbi:MAG TPA: helix-turn-helix transcriptional regulator [Ktedonobacteraceae bacterium]|jgi:transcriptional regulator with XRE-family HTH domain